MAEITYNGVKYTNVPNKKAGTKFAASLTQSNIGASQTIQDYVNSENFYPLVNAIDINWNGIEIGENSYINSTSDLVSYISTKGSNVDLSSYATMAYVDQKITDLIGGAPETLDTLKELADALENDASLAYVTEALNGKADKSSLTNYATNSYVTTELDKKANKTELPDMNNYSTVSYVTTELDKKANKSEIPSMPDLTPYVSYEQANSYYAGKNEIPDMTNYVSVSSYNSLAARVEELASWIVSYHTPTPEPITGTLAFGWADLKMNENDVLTPPLTNTYVYDSITYTSSNTSVFTVDSSGTCTGIQGGNATLTAQLYNNTTGDYITETSIPVYVSGTFAFGWADLRMNVGDVLTPPLTNTYIYDNIAYISDNQSVFTVDQSGACTAIQGGNANLTAQLYNNTTREYVTQTSIPVIVSGGPEPSYDFHFDEQNIDMNIGDTVTPTITNTYPDYTNISYTSSDSSVVSVDSNGTCTALTLGQATISATLYDNNNNEQDFASVQFNVNKFVPVAYWSFNGTALPNDEMVVLPYDTLTQSTYTFYSNPATGWNVSNTLYETPGITIDNSTHTITVDPTSFKHTGKSRVLAEYNEDSSYQGKGYAVEFKILAQGVDPQFFFASDDIYISNKYSRQDVQLYDLTGLMEQGYTPTLAVGNSSYVSVAPRQDIPNIMRFTWLAEGETTVTATITDGNNTHSTTINVHCKYDREDIEAHLVNTFNNDSADYYYGLPKNSGTRTFNFIANRAYGREPLIGFNTTVVGDTNNAITITHSQTTNNDSIAFVVSVDTSKLANMNDFDDIEIQIERPQDSTTNAYSGTKYLRVIPAGADPGLYWDENILNFVVGTYYAEGQDIIYNRLINSTGGTPTVTIADTTIAHMADGNTLYGDSVGTTTLTATVTDGNNNTRTATITVNVTAS